MKIVSFGENFLKKVFKGIDIADKIVGSTLGPKGSHVAYEKYKNTYIINDGVTIIQELELSDPIENLGLNLIKEVAKKVNDVVGDGTTTAVILVSAIAKLGLNCRKEKLNVALLSKYIEEVKDFLLKKLSSLSHSIDIKNADLLSKVATISCKDKFLGNLISTAYQEVGVDGLITVQESNSLDTFLTFTEGLEIQSGYISHHFVNDSNKMEFFCSNVRILLVDSVLSSAEEMVKILNFVSSFPNSALLIVAEDIKGDAMTIFAYNRLRREWPIIGIKIPSVGQNKLSFLSDISVLTGANIISKAKGMTFEKLKIEDFGIAESVKINESKTIIIRSDSINKTEVGLKIKKLKEDFIKEKSEYKKSEIKQRIAHLSGKIAVIKVGAASEIEMKDKKLRLEDAINSTFEALKAGIVSGGGATYVRLYKELQQYSSLNAGNDLNKKHIEYEKSIQIMLFALLQPIKRLLANSQIEDAIVIKNILQSSNSYIAFDVLNNKFVDALEHGIIDPTNVIKTIIIRSVSVASLLLTAIAGITEEKKTENKNIQNRMPF